jgi:methyl-accepting chemotaxis protein
MSIRATLVLVFVTLLGLLAGLLTTSYLAARAQQEAARAERQRFDSWKLADELRQSSDDLTRMARTFVVTGDPFYRDSYQAILAIRNGTKARPRGYDGIYWDFALATRTPPTAVGRAVALEQLMRDAEFTEAEFARLAEAQRRSDELVHLESVAMNAVEGRFEDASGGFTITREADLELARQLVHGSEYHREKAAIMEPIGEFFEMLDERTAGAALSAEDRAHRFGRATIVLSIVTIVVALLAVVLLRQRIIAPIRAMRDRLQDMAEGEGDLTRRVAEDRRDEFGELGRWFNRFVRTVHDIVGRVTTTSGSVATAAAEIGASARDQQQTVASFGSSTTQIAAALKEISATGSELARTMDEVSGVAGDSAATAESGRAGLGEMQSTMRELVESTDAFTTGLTVLDERAAGITRIVTTIVKVADQTDLLSVNAAIEAEKAGATGAGFHVVAREIRHLADQTAEATLEIDRDVKEIQTAVSDGVRQMGRFGENVRQVDETVTRLSEQLGRIIEQVQRLSTRFESVNEGMAQQTAGVGQINDAMGSLTDSADRTTTALAEFSGAADHLREATVELEGEIGRFKLKPASAGRT